MKKALAVVFALAVALTGCACAKTPLPKSKGPVTVGSKIDTEGKLLGTMIALVLENDGFRVVDKTQTGTTGIVRRALLEGEIDIYPEYTGSGLIFFMDQDPALYKDAQQGYETVKSLDLARNGMVWLAPAKANNTWAIAVKKDFADANRLETMSDLARYIKAGKRTKLACSDEFLNNPDAMPAFKKTYGFSLRKDQTVVLSGGNTAQTEKAVADGTDGVNLGMAYGTDGALSDLGLVVLTDDLEAQLVYWPTPVVRKATLDQYPEIETLLAPVFGSLTLQRLQELNARIQVKGEAAEAVATDHLKKNGLLK